MRRDACRRRGRRTPTRSRRVATAQSGRPRPDRPAGPLAAPAARGRRHSVPRRGIGGLARYGITQTWPAPARGLPAATLAINTGGAFALALLVVLTTEVWAPGRHVHPLLVTGFPGAFTTFSSVVTNVDTLVAHGHVGTAGAYLAASLSAGLAAASLGLLLGRAFVVRRHRPRDATPPVS